MTNTYEAKHENII